MLPGYFLSLREGLEAALIIGIVLGSVLRMHREDLIPTVWLGVFSATVLSLLVAVLLTFLGLHIEGNAEKIYEGSTMFLAAGILTWMVLWMSRQARNIRGELENGVQKATFENGKRGLFVLAFLAVLREGIELALFLVASVFASDVQQTLIGALLGVGTAILLGWSLFATTVRLDLRRFFQVTSILLILFAAGLVAHAVHEFNEAGWIPAIVEHVWDVNNLLDENSTVGVLLKALFGYNGNPSLSEALAYLVYFLVIFTSLRSSDGRFGRSAQKLA
jgi:high-affinity iron transporter